MDSYRILNKQNVNMSGKRTAFDVYKYSKDQAGYVFEGRHTAAGYNAPDSKCVEAFEALEL